MPGWKTVLFNALIAVLAIVAELLAYFEHFDWRLILEAELVPWVVVSINVANIVLRHVTTGPPAWRRSDGGDGADGDNDVA